LARVDFENRHITFGSKWIPQKQFLSVSLDFACPNLKEIEYYFLKIGKKVKRWRLKKRAERLL